MRKHDPVFDKLTQRERDLLGIRQQPVPRDRQMDRAKELAKDLGRGRAKEGKPEWA